MKFLHVSKKYLSIVFIFLFISMGRAQLNLDIEEINKSIAGFSNKQKWEYIVGQATEYSISDPNRGLQILNWLEKQPFFENRFTSGYLLRKAILLKNSGNQKLALNVYEEALHKAKKDKDTLNMAGILFKLADTYDEMAMTDKMMLTVREALSYYTALKDTSFMIKCYLKMNNADKLSNYRRTIDQLIKLLPLAKNDSTSLAAIYSSIANVFETNNRMDSAFYYNAWFLKYIQKENLPDRFVALYNSGQNLKDMGRFKEAHEYFMKALIVNQSLKLDFYNTYAYLALAELEQKMGQDIIALDHLSKINQKDLNIEQKKQFEYISYEIHKNRGKLKQALYHHENYKLYADSVNNTEKLKAISEIRAKYDVEIKEEQVKFLEERNIQNRQLILWQRYGLLLLAIMLTALIYLLIVSRRQKNQIASKNDIIMRNLEEKDILLKEIHHRVKNNLQVVSSLLNLQSNYITDDAALDAINAGKSRVAAMSLIHQNLYRKENLTSIETRSYFEDLLDQIFETYNIAEDKIHITKTIDSMMLDVDLLIPIGLVVNELISNALKHAFKEVKTGNIELQILDHGDALSIIVKDSGIGVSRETFHSKHSFGNKMITAFIQKLNSHLHIAVNEGTTFSFTVQK